LVCRPHHAHVFVALQRGANGIQFRSMCAFFGKGAGAGGGCEPAARANLEVTTMPNSKIGPWAAVEDLISKLFDASRLSSRRLELIEDRLANLDGGDDATKARRKALALVDAGLAANSPRRS
jgi:hypothetical protein